MKKIASFLLLALVCASSAQANFKMHGAQPYQWQWAQQAQQYVPLANATVNVVSGKAMYSPAAHELAVPFDTAKNRAQGWTAHTEQGLFLHELGHVYDDSTMTPAQRAAFEEIIGTTCAWRAKVCPTTRYGSTINVPVEEMFAEEYAACALGLTQAGYQAAGFNTYGWLPPTGTDSQLCALIAT